MKLFIISILFSCSAMADGFYLGGWSHHLKTDGMNEQHNFIAVEYNNFIAGTFKNSYSDTSFMIAYDWAYDFDNSISIGAWTGITTGYDCDLMPMCVNGVVPAVVPYVTIKALPLQPVVALFGEALFLTVKVEFK
jgi:hypothetical protein